MELRQLNTLVNILDYGGFAAAGESIGLTQSAVSLQIKALEEELGEDLFDRSKRPPTPNAKAIALAQKAREILHMCNDLSDFNSEQLSGSLHLGAVPAVQQTLLPRALKKIRREHPDLFINITSGLSDELCRSVHRGVLDAAIVSEPSKLATGMSWHPFSSESLVIIANKKISDLDSLETEEILQTQPFIRFKRTTWAGELIDREMKDRGIKVKTVIETDNLVSIWEMINCDLGVSIVPHHFVKMNPDEDMSHPLYPNIKMMLFNKNATELITGLVERTADPKSHLISGLHNALLP